MGFPWQSHGLPVEFHGSPVGTPWESPGNTMGKLCESYGSEEVPSEFDGCTMEVRSLTGTPWEDQMQVKHRGNPMGTSQYVLSLLRVTCNGYCRKVWRRARFNDAVS